MSDPLGITDWYEALFKWIWLSLKIIILFLILSYFITKDLKSKNLNLEIELQKCNKINELLLEKINAQKE